MEQAVWGRPRIWAEINGSVVPAITFKYTKDVSTSDSRKNVVFTTEIEGSVEIPRDLSVGRLYNDDGTPKKLDITVTDSITTISFNDAFFSSVEPKPQHTATEILWIASSVDIERETKDTSALNATALL